MLLSISHQPPSSGQRIPPSLFDLYVQYKKDTRAIIAWLLSHGSSKCKNLRSISTRDLLGLAEVVQKKAVVMPDTIDFQFREAIAARKQLSNFFRTESDQHVVEEDTINHEFFTESLTKIYTGLCECCAKPVEDCKRTNERKRLENLRNRFAPLKLGTTDNSYDDGTEPSSETKDAREGFDTVPPVDEVPQLVDDPLSDAFAVCKELQEMDDLLLATKKGWEQAAKGEIPLAVAALITNVVFARFEEVEQQLKLTCGSCDPGVLRTKLVRGQASLIRLKALDDVVDSPAIMAIESLQQSWHLLLNLKNNARPTTLDIEPGTRKTSSIALRIGPNSAEADEKCLEMVLLNIKQHVLSRSVPTDIVRAGSPLYAEIGYFLTHKENDVNGLRCTFGLRMLLDAYKSFMLACQGTGHHASCRLQALKLAQEALPCIAAVLGDPSMPCRCPQTLAFHLGNLENDFKDFLQEKCFDLYFQSPWVSGSHILEMHETLFYYGLRLFSYRNYVGSVVHVYHVLREVIGFRAVPLLEQLRDTFSDVLFPGGRPSRNFKACCLRYMGGRLRFRANAPDHKSGSHHMVIPAHTARTTAGFGLRKEANDSRFAYCKVSVFYSIKERGYHVDESLWSRTHALAKPSVAGKDRKGHVCAHNHLNQEPTSNSCLDQLSQLQKAVLTDCAGPFPIAKINFFQVYMSCVQIVSIISDKTHDGEERGRSCLCFLDVMVQAADRYRANEHRLQPFGCKELVATCREAIEAVLGDKSLDDFLWKIF